MDIRYGSSNVVLDASIYNDEHMRGITWGLDSHINELMNSWFEIIIIAFAKLNKKQLEKLLIILQSRANSGLRRSKEGKISLKQLSISTTEPLIDSLWHFEREPSDKEWSLGNDDILGSVRDHSM